MAIKEICRMGNPVLREEAKELPEELFGSFELDQLLIDMRDTMEHLGGIGIAAPQIGISYQVCIIDVPVESERYPDTEESDEYIIINPTIEVINDQKIGIWEGCLSVPGLRGYVPRNKTVVIRYQDLDGEPQQLEVDGFLAIVFQHELDHLFGKLYVDRIEDPKNLVFEEEYVKYIQPTEIKEE